MATTGVTSHGRTTPRLLNATQPEPEVNGDLDPEEEEVVLEGEELFMTLTEEEKEAWEKMMAEKESDLKSRKENFQKWYDGITRRRMFAYSRVRKLTEGYRQRANFYSDLSEYVSAVEAKLKVRKNSQGQGEKDKVNEDSLVNGRNDVTVNGSDNAQKDQQQQQQQQTQQQQQQVQQQQPNEADTGKTVTVHPL